MRPTPVERGGDHAARFDVRSGELLVDAARQSEQQKERPTTHRPMVNPLRVGGNVCTGRLCFPTVTNSRVIALLACTLIACPPARPPSESTALVGRGADVLTLDPGRAT